MGCISGHTRASEHIPDFEDVTLEDMFQKLTAVEVAGNDIIVNDAAFLGSIIY